MHKTIKILLRLWALALLPLASTALIIAGCASSSGHAAAPGTQPTTQATAPTSAPTKGGAQLWSENCNRCHNTRSPTSFSRGEWQVIMHHMRVRANLTGQEQRTILEFLKSAD